MHDRLVVAVTRDRYPTRFNTPKPSRHIVKPTRFIPTHRISRRIEGITLFPPVRCDLIHSVNRIPIATDRKFVISFESHLPRFFGGELTRLFAFMRRRLAGPACRRIIALSQFAQKAFLATHVGTDEFDALAAKLTVVYPNIVLPDATIEPRDPAVPLKLVFVGSHFGRKGGAVAARAAELARRRDIPLHVHIISTLEVGASVWSDPKDRSFFEPYLGLLKGSNITFHSSLPNDKVLEVLRQSDFSILTTLSDTFGYSAIESLAVGTPVIATPQGALPEFVVDGQNGLMIPLDVDAYGEWIHVGRSDKDSRRYEALYRDEIERMAESLVKVLSGYIEAPGRLSAMRQSARATAERQFANDRISPVLDEIYETSA